MPSRRAFHETGHVLIATSLGVAIEFVEIAGSTPILARTHDGSVVKASGCVVFADDKIEPFTDLAIALAGIEAEHVFCPDLANRQAAGNDLEYVAKLYPSALSRPAPKDIMADSTLLELRVFIREIFDRCRGEFLAFAERLDQQKYIDGDECRQAFRTIAKDAA